jgi:hypothetical protein
MARGRKEIARVPVLLESAHAALSQLAAERQKVMCL